MSFALTDTDTDQYPGKQDVYMKGRIRIVFSPKLGSYLGRKMKFFGRIQLYKLCILAKFSISYQLICSISGLATDLPMVCKFNWHERAAFQRSSFGRSRSGGRLLAMT